MAKTTNTKTVQEPKITEEQSVATNDLLAQIEALKKQLEEKATVPEKVSDNKIADNVEIEIESGLNSSLSFYDDKGRIFYTAEFEGLGSTDTIPFGELKKIRSSSGKSKYLTRGFFIIKPDDDKYDFNQVIKELRLTSHYSGKLNFSNMEEIMTKGSAKVFIDGINEIKDKKSEMVYIMVDRFKHLYDKGLIKDIDKVNQMKYIVKKENGSVDLFG